MSQVTGRRVARSMDWANMCGNPLQLHTSHVDAYIIDQFQEKIQCNFDSDVCWHAHQLD